LCFMKIFWTILQVRLVRVTKRVHEAYFAQLFLSKVCNWSLIYNLHSALET
jgi:hypothetical protein